MSVRAVVGLLVLAPGAAAQRYAAATGGCDGTTYCTIQTPAECELAAAALSHPDTTARHRNKVDQVAGCNTNGNGNLRFNYDLTSSVVHNTAQGQQVFCVGCGEATTTTAGPNACDISNPYCVQDGECYGSMNACPIADKATCESASASLGMDSTANDLNDATKVGACSVNAGGGLRFNTAATVEAHNADQGQKVICEYCSPCESDLYCTMDLECMAPACNIDTLADCEAAAAVAGTGDSTANPLNTADHVYGCSYNAGGGLRFNEFVSARQHANDRGQVVVCTQCV